MKMNGASLYLIFVLAFLATEIGSVSQAQSRGDRPCYSPGGGRYGCGGRDQQSDYSRGRGGMGNEGGSNNRSGGGRNSHEDVVQEAVEFLNNAARQTRNGRFSEIAQLLNNCPKREDQGSAICASGTPAFASGGAIYFCRSGRPPVDLLIHEATHLSRENHSYAARFGRVPWHGTTISPGAECDAESVKFEVMALNNRHAVSTYQGLGCPDSTAGMRRWSYRGQTETSRY